MTSELLKIDAAQCRLDQNRTLNIPHFMLSAGQHYCIFGANGSGKSLLGELISGRSRLSQTLVSYAEGFDPARDCQVVSFEEQQRLWALDSRHDISEYSDTAHDPGTTVEQLVFDGQASTPEIERILNTLGIADLKPRGIRYLSSGQVRKVMIAAALAKKPRLLILDDPLESIDGGTRGRVADLFCQYMSANNALVLLSRREQDVLPGMTHLALMDDLTLVAAGSYTDVCDSALYHDLFRRPPAVPQKLPSDDDIDDRDQQYVTGGPDDTPLIELCNVSAAYQSDTVFHDLNWTFRSSDHALIRGPNGCGKSTLLSLVNGENHKAYGQAVYLFGRKRGTGETVWDIKSRFGVVSNELHNRYVKGWRALDVVVSGFFDSVGLYDDSVASQHTLARSWLRALGLTSVAGEYYQHLSFGQQRLILIARAMVKSPDVLILDEPCVGLDDYYSALIPALVDRIAASGHTRIIYVSHAEDDEPACITQRLLFEPAETGYRLIVRQLPAR